jgi:hypothetical protein
LATLLIALLMFPTSSVIAAITARVMTASTTPYSAIVCPSSRRAKAATASAASIFVTRLAIRVTCPLVGLLTAFAG